MERKIISNRKPAEKPVKKVAQVHINKLNKITDFLLKRSPTYPAIGTKIPIANIKAHEINPNCTSFNPRSSRTAGKAILNTCRSAWLKKKANQSNVINSQLNFFDELDMKA